MKSTRRGFLSRVAAIAAAVSLAPAVKAEAAPINVAGEGGAPCHQCGTDAEFPHVYGHPEMPTLTFEAMAADCAGRGCRLTYGTGGYWHETAPFDGIKMGLHGSGILETDAWRRGLHEQAEPPVHLEVSSDVMAMIDALAVSDCGGGRLG